MEKQLNTQEQTAQEQNTEKKQKSWDEAFAELKNFIRESKAEEQKNK